MRVKGTLLGLLVVLGLTGFREVEHPHTQDRDTALGQSPAESITAFQPSRLPLQSSDPVIEMVALITPELEANTPEPEIVMTTNTFPSPAATVLVTATSVPFTPTPQANKVAPGTEQTVLITFYYCHKTVEKSDDGGGYCGNTASGIPVHPGSAACPRSWMGRSFTIPIDPNLLTYKCEDVGGGVTGNHVDIWFDTNSEGWSSPITGQGRTIIWQD